MLDNQDKLTLKAWSFQNGHHCHGIQSNAKTILAW